jgi:hypothetical protein
VENANITHNILIDLDAILDTRLATYHAMDTSLPGRLIENGYYNRISDEMSNVLTEAERKEFIHRYKNRENNLKTLKYALPTNMNRYLVDLYHGFTADQLINASRYRSTLFINLYPYLIPNDMRPLIKNLLVADLYPYCDIELVNIDTSKENIIEFLSRYQEYITYESIDFINHWLVDYEGTVSPGFKLTIPKIAIGDKSMIDLDKDSELERESLYDGLEGLRTAFMGIMYLGFLPPKFYSPRQP